MDSQLRARLIRYPWFVRPDAAHDFVPSRFGSPPLRWAPTEHLERTIGLVTVADRNLPERPPARINRSLHTDIERQPNGYAPLVVPEVSRNDLSPRIEDWMRKREFDMIHCGNSIFHLVLQTGHS